MTHTAFHTNRYYCNVLGFKRSGPLTTSPMPTKPLSSAQNPAASPTSHSLLTASGLAPKFVVVQRN